MEKRISLIGKTDAEVNRTLTKEVSETFGTSLEKVEEWKNKCYPINPQLQAYFAEMIKKHDFIVVVGDYDCDGVMATGIMLKGIPEINPDATVEFIIPYRFSDGYGLKESVAERVRKVAAPGSLVITVDNGINSADVIRRLKADHYDVIVTDHHILSAGNVIPEADLVIDPQVDEIQNPFSMKGYCGAAVVYKLFENLVSESVWVDMETMAGIATVTDRMEIREENFKIVFRALEHIRKKECSVRIRDLCKGHIQDADVTTFGYYVGPIVNAAGRLEDCGAEKVNRFLMLPNGSRAAKGAREELYAINDKRKAISESVEFQAEQYIVENGLQNDCPILARVENAHEGVVGIVAGHIADKYKTPTIIVTNSKKDPDILKGSGRTYGDYNLHQYVSGISSYLKTFGGHPGAVGLSLSADLFAEVQKMQDVGAKEKIQEATRLIFDVSPDNIGAAYWAQKKLEPLNTALPRPQVAVHVNPRSFGEFEKIDLDEFGEDNVHKKIRTKDDLGRYMNITLFSAEKLGFDETEKCIFLGELVADYYHGKETPSVTVRKIIHQEELEREYGEDWDREF